MNKKIICGFMACLLGMSSALAIPAKHGVTRTVTLSDGTTTTVQLCGDETFHFYITPEGRPVRQTEDGTWILDTRDVHKLWTEANAKRNKSRQRLAEKMRRQIAPRRAGTADDPVQTKKGLLILVNFTDKKMVYGDNSQVIYDQELNAIGQPYGKNNGSVREYFLAQSYGQFDIHFDVVGPVTVSQKMAYYGGNDSRGNDKAPEKMVYEACKLVDDIVNFADYDWDGDGEVENIYVTYAGHAESAGASDDTIWPHQWSLLEAYGYSLKLDGVKIDTYACGAELYGSSGTTLDGIGTMCHEYSHCLGLPDFYDTEYSGNFGMSDWSILDGGCYNGDGYCPAGYTAYERWFSGWLTPTVLNESCTISDMENIEDNPEAYVIYNDANKDEYYLLANHQLKGWDKKAPGHGLMIIHVDYDKDVWASNEVNNTKSRQRMTLIPADNELKMTKYQGSYYSVADAGDLWPGTKKNKALTDTSTPAAKLNTNNTDGNKLMHKPIEDITEANGLISFSFMGGKPVLVETPVLGEPTDVTEDGFNIEWTADENAVSYNLQIKTTTVAVETVEASRQLLLTESFDKFIASSNTDVSKELDSYTTVPGWTGTNVFTDQKGARLATTDKGGSLTTPLLQGQTEAVTLLFSCYGYDLLSSVTVALIDASGKTLKTSSFKSQKDPILVVFENGVPENFKLSFSANTKKRLSISNLYIYDGAFTNEALADGESTVTKTTITNKIVSDLTVNHYEATGLTPGAMVDVTVQAVDVNGNTSPWSEVISFELLGSVLLGDVNGDGQVDLTDAILIVYHSLGEAQHMLIEAAADMNGDGKIDLTDAIIVVYQSLATESQP